MITNNQSRCTFCALQFKPPSLPPSLCKHFSNHIFTTRILPQSIRYHLFSQLFERKRIHSVCMLISRRYYLVCLRNPLQTRFTTPTRPLNEMGLWNGVWGWGGERVYFYLDIRIYNEKTEWRGRRSSGGGRLSVHRELAKLDENQVAGVDFQFITSWVITLRNSHWEPRTRNQMVNYSIRDVWTYVFTYIFTRLYRLGS